MVRHKRRWLFVRVQFERDLLGEKATSSLSLSSSAARSRSSPAQTRAGVAANDDLFPSKKELNRLIRDTMMECFGIAASGSVNDIQVRFCDAATRMALIRIPRDLYGQARATFSFLGSKTTTCSSNKRNKGILILDVFAVHGSTRTAKMAAIREIQAIYRPWIRAAVDAAAASSSRNKETDQLCLELEGLLASIQALE